MAPQLPSHVIAAVERAMQKDRAARFSDVTAFVQAIEGGDAALGATGRTARQGSGSLTPSSVARAGALVDSHAAGEQTPALGSAAATGNRALGKYVIVAVLGLAAAAAGFTVVSLRRQNSNLKPSVTAPPASTSSAPPTAQVAAPPPVGVAPPLVQAPPPPPVTPPAIGALTSPPVAVTVPVPVAPPLRNTHVGHVVPAVPVAESPAARVKLDEAEQLLGAGNLGEAIHRAYQSLSDQKTPRAYRILTKAFCAQGDLGNAKGAFYNVAPSERARIKHECQKLGLDL